MVSRFRGPLIRRINMNAVFLGIFTKTAFLTLGMIGLLLSLIRLGQGRRRQFLPLAILTPWEFSLPARAYACWLNNLPSRAPPGMTIGRQAATERGGFC